MFILEYSFLPSVGQVAQARQISAEYTTSLENVGIQSVLYIPLASVCGTDVLYLHIHFQRIDALGRFRVESSQGGVGSANSSFASCLREPPRIAIYETLLPSQGHDWEPRYVSRILRIPASGQNTPLREKCLRLTEGRQAQGYVSRLSVEAAGPSAGTCEEMNFWRDLDEWAVNRSRTRGNSEYLSTMSEFSPLMSFPHGIELLEVVVGRPG
jgi:hypothetical protein